MEFQNRNSSLNPSILRLEYNDVYIYNIKFYVGCDCNYLGCDNYRLLENNIKVRSKTGELIRTKEGKSKVCLSRNDEVTPDMAIAIYKDNYK